MRFTANGQNLPTLKVLRFNFDVRDAIGRFIPTGAIDTQAAPWLTGHDTSAGEDPYLVRDRRIVTVFTQTGGVSTHPLHVIDGDYDGIEGDPYLFAETGRTGR